ncbi:hypothetical protein [Streptomyces sp. NPDC029526]|uniref:hypothetical protein n=1 Tax=Streptomyces sp. NPDC029526 TaxID=3155728 RepID=UPI0033E898B9
MSRRLVRTLTCDKPGCAARFLHGTGVRLTPYTVLRHTSRAAGWNGAEGQDYCPAHEGWPGFAPWALAGLATNQCYRAPGTDTKPRVRKDHAR